MGGKKTVLALTALTAAAAVFYTAASFLAGRETLFFYRLDKEETIESLCLENANGRFQFSREGETWTVRKAEEGSPKYSAGREKMKLLLDAVGNLKLTRALETDDPEYGFESSGIHLDFSTSKGNTYGFVVGNETMTRSNIYVKDSVTGKTGVTGLEAAAQLGGSIDAYREREIFHVDMKDIRTVTYREQGEEALSLVKTGGGWNMTAPYQAPAREIEISELLAAMKDWNLCAFADTATCTEEQMGLDGTESFLTLTDGSGASQTLEIGRPVQTLIPVRSGGKDDILLLYADEVDLSALEADTLLFFAPLKVPADEADKILLSVKDHTLEFTLDSGAERFTCNGRTVDAEDFYSFYLSYMGLAATGGDGNAPPEGAGELAYLETVLKDGTSRSLRLVNRDGATCYMVVNNSYSGFYVSNEKLIALISKLSRMGNY